MKRWLFWIGILISAILILFSLRGLQLQDVWGGIRTANFIWIIPGILVYFLAVWTRAIRWQYLLRPTTSLSIKQVFPVVAIGYMGNNIYPARAGELLRSVVLKHSYQTPIPASLATIIVERIFDGIVMLAFIIMNLPVVTNLAGMGDFSLPIQKITLWTSFVFLGTLILFIITAIYSEKAQKLIMKIAEKVIPKKWVHQFQTLMKKTFFGLRSLSSLSDMFIILLISFVVWFLETGLYWFIMQAFSFRVDFSILMLLNGILNLLTIIPSSPGYIGTFDAPSIALLVAFGVNPEASASYTLLLHAVLWLPITIVGALYFGKVGLNWSEEMHKAKVEKIMKIAVIGAGAGGLTAAFDLQKMGHEVTVFERESSPGGLAAGFKEDTWDWSLEKFYHHWFETDQAILALIDELGLKDKVTFKRPTTVVFHEGKFFPLDSPVSVLLFPGFSLIDKIRFGFITVFLKYISRWEPLEKYTAVEWIKKYYGENLYKIFFQPMLVGKFSDHYQEVNMAWLWARFKARSSRLGTFQGGFQAFLNQFSEILETQGVQLSFNTTISEIRSTTNNKIELLINGNSHIFDQVLATTSPKLVSNLTPQFEKTFVDKIDAQKNIGALVLIVSLKQPLSLDGYYWFNLPKSAGFPFLALVEHTNFLSPAHFNNEHLIYCGDYLDKSHPYFSMSKEELTGLFLPSFKQINEAFTNEWVNRSWLFKVPYAQPIPRINHSKNLLPISTPIPGLFMASMSQVYPWDRGTNYAVELAHRAVLEMAKASHFS